MQDRKIKAEKCETKYQLYNLQDIPDCNIVKEVLNAKQDASASLKDLHITIKLDDKENAENLKPKFQEKLDEDADKGELLNENESMVNDEIYTLDFRRMY